MNSASIGMRPRRLAIVASSRVFSNGRPRRLSRALGLARAAPFRFVTKTLVGEKRLLSRRPDEAASAVDTLQSLVLELHWPAPKSPMLGRSWRPVSGDNFRRLTQGGGGADTGPNGVPPVPARGRGSEPALVKSGVASSCSASGQRRFARRCLRLRSGECFLYILDDIFLLDLALETADGADRLPLQTTSAFCAFGKFPGRSSRIGIPSGNGLRQTSTIVSMG
jgi:hypothetical protein